MTSSLDASGITQEPYSRASLPGILDLLQRSGQDVSGSLFTWEFEQNPVGAVNIHVAKAEDQVVGIACHNSFKMIIGGDEEVVSFPLQVVTDPRFRGRGIFSMLEAACEDEAAARGNNLMLSFPNDASTPIFLKKLGWQSLVSPRYFARPVRSAHLIRGVVGFDRGSRVVGAFLDRVFAGLERSHSKTRASIVEESSFGEWSDDLYTQARETFDFAMARHSEYLNWRFIDKPGDGYRIFRVVGPEGGDVGYFVLGWIVKSSYKLGFVASSLLLRDHTGIYEAIRRALPRQLDEPVDLRLDLLDPALKCATKQIGWGYLPAPKRLNFIGKALTERGANLLKRDERAPAFQLGDLDFF